MIQQMRNLLKIIDLRYPLLGFYLHRLYNRKPLLNSVKKKIRGNRNTVSYDQVLLSKVTFDILGNGNSIEIKNNAELNAVKFYLRGDNHTIYIGENCKFSQGGSIWVEDSGCQLVIGDGCTFENVHIAITEPDSKMIIGKDCMFAYDIDIRTGDSHSILDTKTNQRINYARNVSIGDHVWVAAHCIILKGVKIPDHSILASGSVVTGEFAQQGVILAGNPARVIKQDITWSRPRRYDDLL